MVFLMLAVGKPWGGVVEHEFPTAYSASDAFFHHAMTEYAKEDGRLKYAAPYSIGGYEGVLDSHPPLPYELAASFSVLTGMETHDTLFMLTVFIYLFAVLAAYLLWRKGSVAVALLALPFALFMLQKRLLPLIYWGYWLLVPGITYMIASLWSLTIFDSKHGPWIMAFLFSAIALSHQPEFVYAGGFFGLFLLYRFYRERKISPAILKKTGVFVLVIGALTFYSLLIFSATFLQTEGYRGAFDFDVARGGYPAFDVPQMGWMGVVALVGVGVFFLMHKKKLQLTGYSFLYSFLLGFLIYLGLGKRAYAQRLFWIIYAAFFIGLALYFVLQFVSKKYRTLIPFVVSIVFILLFSRSLGADIGKNQGIMNEYDWDGLQWIAANLPSDAWVHYLYSDTLIHNAPLYNSEHLAFKVGTNSYIKLIQTGTLQRNFSFGFTDGYIDRIHDRGVFDFCYFDQNLKPRNESFECVDSYIRSARVPLADARKDLCDMEYVYITKQTSQPAFGQYNSLVREVLLSNNWTNEIYSNPLVSLVHNTQPGVECLNV